MTVPGSIALCVPVVGLLWALPASGAPPYPGSRWRPPSAQVKAAWSSAKLALAKRRWRALGTTGLMVIHRGRAAISWGDVSRRVKTHSVRKSLLSALYGAYVGRGKIDISKTMLELNIDDKQGLSATERAARISDLLKGRSGIYHPAAAETKSMRKRRPPRGSHGRDSFWYYNNWDFNALGTIFRKLTGKDIFSAFYQDIARPIAMQDFRARDGRYAFHKCSRHPAYVFYMSVRDRARFGLLMLRKGRWRGRQIVPRSWIAESTRSYSRAKRGVGYGYMWWVATSKRFHFQTPLGPGAYSARGVGGQFIIVAPARDLVIAHATDLAAGHKKTNRREFNTILKLIVEAMPGRL